MKNKLEQDTLDQQKKHFNSISEDYYNFRQKSTHLMFKKLLWDYFFKRNKHKIIKNNKKIAVMEAMCGYCEAKQILEDSLTDNFAYSAFDYSEEMVKIAKNIFPDSKIFQQDITKFKEKEKYDLLIVIGGIHHVYNFADESVANISNSLKKGGHLIMLEPTNNNKMIAKIREYIYQKNDFFDNETEHDFKLKDLNKLLKDNGLRVVDQLYPGLLAYILFYNPDAFKSLRILNSKALVKVLFAMERPLYSLWLGKKASFCTLTLASKE